MLVAALRRPLCALLPPFLAGNPARPSSSSYTVARRGLFCVPVAAASMMPSCGSPRASSVWCSGSPPPTLRRGAHGPGSSPLVERTGASRAPAPAGGGARVRLFSDVVVKRPAALNGKHQQLAEPKHKTWEKRAASNPPPRSEPPAPAFCEAALADAAPCAAKGATQGAAGVRAAAQLAYGPEVADALQNLLAALEEHHRPDSLQQPSTRRAAAAQLNRVATALRGQREGAAPNAASPSSSSPPPHARPTTAPKSYLAASAASLPSPTAASTPPDAASRASSNMSASSSGSPGKAAQSSSILINNKRTKVCFIDGVGSELEAAVRAARDAGTVSVDCEGVELSRVGELCLLQLATESCTYILDIATMGPAAFSHVAEARSRLTLKGLLESERVTKLFFDVRTDSDALFHQFGIRLQGVLDVQVEEVATRRDAREQATRLKGLGPCLDLYLPALSEGCSDLKRQVKQMYATHAGGEPLFWKNRPLNEMAIEYAALDVQLLLQLHRKLQDRLSPSWNSKVLNISYERLGEFRDLEVPIMSRTPNHTLAPYALLPQSKKKGPKGGGAGGGNNFYAR